MFLSCNGFFQLMFAFFASLCKPITFAVNYIMAEQNNLGPTNYWVLQIQTVDKQKKRLLGLVNYPISLEATFGQMGYNLCALVFALRFF